MDRFQPPSVVICVFGLPATNAIKWPTATQPGRQFRRFQFLIEFSHGFDLIFVSFNLAGTHGMGYCEYKAALDAGIWTDWEKRMKTERQTLRERSTTPPTQRGGLP